MTKTKGAVFEFTRQRNRDLLDAYRKCLAEAEGEFTMRDIMERVVERPCSRFWVTWDTAMRIVPGLLADKEAMEGALKGMLPSKRRMYREIARRCGEVLESEPGTPLADVVRGVVERPAPAFFMTPGWALQVIYRMKEALRSQGRVTLYV